MIEDCDEETSEWGNVSVQGGDWRGSVFQGGMSYAQADTLMGLPCDFYEVETQRALRAELGGTGE